MGVWKTSFRTILLGLAMLTQASVALSDTAPDLRTFAVCAGRYSALVEHQWIVDSPASDISSQSRDAMLELVAAVMPKGMAKTAMGWRIEAKVAQRALLDRAYFAQDTAAEKRSAQLLQACADLIGLS